MTNRLIIKLKNRGSMNTLITDVYLRNTTQLFTMFIFKDRLCFAASKSAALKLLLYV